MQEFKHVIQNSQGIYAETASVLVKTANEFESRMKLLKRGKSGDLKHVVSVAALGVQAGDEVKVIIDGTDEIAAAKRMEEVFKQMM